MQLAIGPGNDFAGFALDLMVAERETNAQVLADRFGYALSWSLEGMETLAKNPRWVVEEPGAALHVLLEAEDKRDKMLRGGGWVSVGRVLGKPGVQAASLVSGAYALVELAVSLPTAVREFAELWAAGIGGGRVAVAAGPGGIAQLVLVGSGRATPWVLTEAQIGALAAAGQLPPVVAQLAWMAQGDPPGAQPGRMGEWLGEGPEAEAVQVRAPQATGLARSPRHHVLPQEERAWFEERGFVGKKDIDHYTIELEEAEHQAIHGGGNRQLAKQWPNEWTQKLMSELQKAERRLGRNLTPKEILKIVKGLLKDPYGIGKPKFIPYRGKR